MAAAQLEVVVALVEAVLAEAALAAAVEAAAEVAEIAATCPGSPSVMKETPADDSSSPPSADLCSA